MAHLLVVDDDVDVLRGLSTVLAQSGYSVTPAESGEQALEILQGGRVDLVILDALMPGLSGFETCALIRERHGLGLPVLMVTAFGDREAMRQATDTGADDLLPKPVDTATLVLRVRSCLRLKSLHDQAARAREEAQARVRDLSLLCELGRAMADAGGRASLLTMTLTRLREEFGLDHASFWCSDEEAAIREEAVAGVLRKGWSEEPIVAALRDGQPKSGTDGGGSLSLPVRAGERMLGVLDLWRSGGGGFKDEETSLLTAIAGHLALALENARNLAETTRLARQMATLYDVGLETSPLRDLRGLFGTASAEAGRLIEADRASILRYDAAEGVLGLFAAWTKDPLAEPYQEPVFRLGEGVAGRVAQQRLPAMVNDVEGDRRFIPMTSPIARLLCVPLAYYDREREAETLFGVLNASRQPGNPPFREDDLRYLTRFASQLSIAVANAMAFAAERERSDQLALLNALLRELAGILDPERIFEVTVARVHDAFRYPLVRVVVPDQATGELRVAVSAGSRVGASTENGSNMELEGRAMRENGTALAPEMPWDAESRGPAPFGRAAVPIRWGSSVTAVLSVESDRRGALGRGEIVTLETLTDGIAIVLRKAELYHALDRVNAQLVELNRTRSELVNIVAHDFRAPLVGLLGCAERLEWRPDAPVEERIKGAQVIVEAATHMSQMVEKTLMTSRLETGEFPFEFAIVDVAEVARSVVRRTPITKRHTIATDIPEDPLSAWADRERLAEVIENLISNALKFSPRGGEVQVTISRRADRIVCGITDRGIGIAAEDMGRLFRPFSRVRTPETSEISGSGLGLFICERIVKAHRGRLWVESQPGQGSTFCLELPAFDVTADDAAGVVLVASSDDQTRREVRRIAQELGCAVHEATDGIGAMEAAERLHPLVILLDRVLPKLRGEEIARRLREASATRGVPLVLMASEIEAGREASVFDACLAKPLDAFVLRETLEQLFSSRR